jgi:hypothetical protein
MADGAELSETILAVDDEHRRVACTIAASPFPIETRAASIQVIDAGGGRSTFRWITDIKPDAVADGLAAMLAGAITSMEEQYSTSNSREDSPPGKATCRAASRTP